MNPLYRGAGVLLIGLLVLSGCQPRIKAVRESDAPPFVFRSLDLRQQDAQGRALWAISSSEARYDLRRKLAQASDLRGTIYLDGQARYRVLASSGVVVNDGEVVQLEGNIRLEQIDDPPTVITASRARWLPSRQLMELDRSPSAYNDRFSIRGRTATFRFAMDRLELRGQPSLRGWPQPFNPLRRLPDGPPELILNARDVAWYPRSGRLVASGPLQGKRQALPGRPSGAHRQGKSGTAILPAGNGSQLLSAAGLEGNTTDQSFRLQGPVRLVDIAANTTLLAGGLSVDLRKAVASTVEGRQGCRILRPAESLQARRCQWNWLARSAQAEGDVVLKRRDHDQSSQAGRLDAGLSGSSTVVLTAPGARVISRFRVPLPPEPARPAPQARQEPEPIRL